MSAVRNVEGPNRRNAIACGVATGMGLGLGPGGGIVTANPSSTDPLSFFVISDTHLHARKDDPGVMEPESVALNDRLIDTLNRLPGQPLPNELGGGEVGVPRGVIHLGDMVDSGDKGGSLYNQMTETEWKHFTDRFGLTGTDGRLRYPLYELHGNHDSPRQNNIVLRDIADRNSRRIGLTNRVEDGLHYSWDWGNIHFVALGIIVGPNADDLPISRYESFKSLDFLVSDLEQHVGDSDRPVIVLHHIDLMRYARPCDTANRGGNRDICCNGMASTAWCNRGCEGAPGISRDEWSHCDIAAYGRAIERYNIAAIFHGHLHARRTEHWNPNQQTSGRPIAVFGAKNSAAGGTDRTIFYCRVENDQLIVREYRSRGERGWHPDQSVTSWTPESWRAPLQA
jgi:cytolysin (calcineurin-like family phosphatase)